MIASLDQLRQLLQERATLTNTEARELLERLAPTLELGSDRIEDLPNLGIRRYGVQISVAAGAAATFAKFQIRANTSDVLIVVTNLTLLNTTEIAYGVQDAAGTIAPNITPISLDVRHGRIGGSSAVIGSTNVTGADTFHVLGRVTVNGNRARNVPIVTAVNPKFVGITNLIEVQTVADAVALLVELGWYEVAIPTRA